MEFSGPHKELHKNNKQENLINGQKSVEYIPHHNHFLNEINFEKEEEPEKILNDIEDLFKIELKNSEKEVFSQQEIPYEILEPIPRSKTENFQIKSRFKKIGNKDLVKDFTNNKLRRKSSLTQNLAFIFMKVIFLAVYNA